MSFGKLGLVLIIASVLFGGLALAMACSLDQEVGKALATGDGQFMIFLGIHPVLEQVHKGNQFIMVLQYATLFAGVLGLASMVVAILSGFLSFLIGSGTKTTSVTIPPKPMPQNATAELGQESQEPVQSLGRGGVVILCVGFAFALVVVICAMMAKR